MKFRTLLPTLTAVLLFAGCSGGGGQSANAPVSPGGALPPAAAPKAVQPKAPVRRPLFSGSGDAVQETKCSAHATTVTCAFTTAPAVGDTIVFFMGYYPASPTITAPTGLSHIDTCTRTEDWDRVVQSGDGNSFQFTANVSEYMGIVAYDVVGADTTNPIDAHNCNATNGTTQTTPSVTPVTSGDLPLASFSNGNRSAFSGLTTGWTNDLNENATYFNFAAHGPIAGTSAVQASITLTGGSGTGGTALVLLKPAPTGSEPIPQIAGVNIFTSCDWFDTDLTQPPCGSDYATTSVDPNSKAILDYYNANNCSPCTINMTFASGSVLVNGHVNRYSTSDSGISNYAMTSGSCNYGCTNTPWNDNPGGGNYNPACTSSCPQEVPWASSGTSHTPYPFEEMNSAGSPPYDCSHDQERHNMILNTSTAIGFETYDDNLCSFLGTDYRAESVSTYNFNHSWNDQIHAGGGDEAHVPLIATALTGADANNPIHHVIEMSAGGTDSNMVAMGGYVLPADSSAHACQNACAHVLPFGARLRLKSSYTCPTSTQANRICVALKTYGMILVDHGGSGGNTTCSSGPSGTCTAVTGTWGGWFLENEDGTNPWNSSDASQISGIPINSTNWDVMTLGTIH